MGIERMASADAAWLRMDQPTNRMVVNTVLWFDEPLDWDTVSDALAERIVGPFRRFRQTVVQPSLTIGFLGMPVWRDDPAFRIERHLHRVTLPAPGDDAALHRYASEQAARPLSGARPLWEAHLIDGFRDGSAILLRTHHAIADGTALVQVLLQLTDPVDGQEQPGLMPVGTDPTSLDLAERVAGAAADAATAMGRAAHRAWSAWVRPQEALDRVVRAQQDAAALRKLGFGLGEERNALVGPLGTAKRLTWSDPIDLEEVRRVGRATGTTVNDVALAVIAGGLRRYLDERGDPPPRQLSAIVPVNVRPVDEPIDPGLGNQFGLAFVRLPVDEEGPAARLATVHRRMRTIKQTREGLVVYGALAAMGHTPEQLQRAWIDVFTRKGSTVVTNIAGPAAPVALAGVPLRGFVLWVPCSGSVGVGLSISSYAGQVVLGVNADAGLVADPDRLLDGLAAEVEALATVA